MFSVFHHLLQVHKNPETCQSSTIVILSVIFLYSVFRYTQQDPIRDCLITFYVLITTPILTFFKC